MYIYFSLDDTKEELDEFQISSRELEAELEAQLEQAENKNKELNSTNSRIQMEVDSLRVSDVTLSSGLGLIRIKPILSGTVDETLIHFYPDYTG